MTGDPIEFTRTEVREIWLSMERVRITLDRIDVVLDDHEQRIRANHEELITQRSERAFTRWIAPVVISIGAVAIAAWGTFFRRE